MGILSELYDQTRGVAYKKDANGKLVAEPITAVGKVETYDVEFGPNNEVSISKIDQNDNEPKTVFEISAT